MRTCYKLSSGLLSVILSNQRVAGLIKHISIDLNDRHSISPAYFQSLIDPDDYKCLTDPVGILRYQKDVTLLKLFGYKLEAGISGVIGAVVGYQGSDAQTVIDVVHEACPYIISSRSPG